MKIEDLTIGVSPFGSVFIGKPHPSKPEWVGDKKEITGQFTKCVIDKFGPDHTNPVLVDGEHKYNIIVLPADKDVIVAGKVVCGPSCVDESNTEEE